eukprot:4269-Heterococcus_DN1.PRE.2
MRAVAGSTTVSYIQLVTEKQEHIATRTNDEDSCLPEPWHLCLNQLEVAQCWSNVRAKVEQRVEALLQHCVMKRSKIERRRGQHTHCVQKNASSQTCAAQCSQLTVADGGQHGNAAVLELSLWCRGAQEKSSTREGMSSIPTIECRTNFSGVLTSWYFLSSRGVAFSARPSGSKMVSSPNGLPCSRALASAILMAEELLTEVARALPAKAEGATKAEAEARVVRTTAAEVYMLMLSCLKGVK